MRCLCGVTVQCEVAMFELFTDRARRVVILAQEEARKLDHNYIGTEHLLLGLLHEGEGAAALILEGLGISEEAARQQVEGISDRGWQSPSGFIPFTPRAKRVLLRTLAETIRLRNQYVGTEHLLLGLVREDTGVAAQVLAMFGTSAEVVTREVYRAIKRPYPPPAEPADTKIAEKWQEVDQAIENQSEGAEDLIEQLRILYGARDGTERATEPDQPFVVRTPSTRAKVEIPQTLADVDARLTEIGAAKDAAIDARDWERTTALRIQEKDLLERWA